MIIRGSSSSSGPPHRTVVLARPQTTGIRSPVRFPVTGRNVVINQPGLPGQPGSQITVPLQTLQTLQPGQGIPTGQAGHLLVKTDNGQYQILRVGSTGGLPPSSSPAVVSSAAPPIASSVSSTPSSAPPPVSSGSGSSSSSSSGMTGQMTPDTAKLKCKNFLATLLRLASEQPESVARNVRNLIQGLIDGQVDPEVFTTRLQRELNSSPQPCLVPFLKRSLPYLQRSLFTNELTIEGVRAPPRNVLAAPPIHSTNHVRMARPQLTVAAPTIVQSPRGRPPLNPANRSVVTLNRPPIPTVSTPRPLTTHLIQHTKIPSYSTAGSAPTPRPVIMPPVTRMPTPQSISTPQIAPPPPPPPSLPITSPSVAPIIPPTPISTASVKEKKSSNTYSVAGDEDINDVAAMGGVNLQEESQRMQGPTDLVGTQIRSCKDETFLQTGLLHSKVAKICRERGLEEPSTDVISLISHATEERLKTLLEKLSIIAEHRMDVVKLEEDYEITQDVKSQLSFLGDLDKLERRRHDEAERELLLRAARSRTRTEDPEKEKLKAKAKELQRFEEERLRHDKANNTALLASGGPRNKKFKLDDNLIGGLGTSKTAAMPIRPRIKRVHQRDLLFLMEQEKELKRSSILWKAYCS
ncbi:transcription initiation factor TFIID subunit 4 [Lepeophtheirus salmonis]|uniref:transcription initiation factor TFIID subunit 4 n=1 Tax=Lepeophtheirus salmonis TaxID=72036 RepID=UPI001AE36D92|nr:transcription initiation factor TFIID subunit 4-like [Lepeophtheirus salmonis]